MKRPALVLAALALALAWPQTAGAQDAAPSLNTTDRTCGAYTVRTVGNGMEDPEDSVSLIRGGRTFVTLKDAATEMQQCGDFTGDGVPDVVLMQYSGGAHCCSVHSIYSLGAVPKRILRTDTADGESVEVRQLDGRGPREIVNTDWRFAYAYGLSFADSPALPRAYAYVGGQYVENTRAYRAWLLGQVTPIRADLAPGDALSSYGLYLLAGQPQAAEGYVARLPADLRAWLRNYAPDIRQNVSTAGYEDWPTRAGVPDGATLSGLAGAFTRPGTHEYLGLIRVGDRASVRLYRQQGERIVSSPSLLGLAIPPESSYVGNFTVRRAAQAGRDDVVLSQVGPQGVTYSAYRVGPAALTRLTADPLAVSVRLLSDLSRVAQVVQQRYDPTDPADSPDRKPLSAQAKAALDRQIAAAVARAQPWSWSGPRALNLGRLGVFNVQSIEVSRENARSALVAGVVQAAQIGKDFNRYDDNNRQTFALFLSRRAGVWQVDRWTLTPRIAPPPER